MRTAIRWSTLFTLFYCLASRASAQTPTAAAVPALTSFSGILTGLDGAPLTGVVGVTLSLYKEQQGGVRHRASANRASSGYATSKP
jgi:hypothetical protein